VLVTDIDEIDLVIVPGIAYDRHFNRLGFGGGFYDRFLADVKSDCVKAAPAFSMQVIDTVPTDIQDVPVDCIITEKCMYKSGGSF
jgi:5-formyltetrahydrofolate cyclo-ligase